MEPRLIEETLTSLNEKARQLLACSDEFSTHGEFMAYLRGEMSGYRAGIKDGIEIGRGTNDSEG